MAYELTIEEQRLLAAWDDKDTAKKAFIRARNSNLSDTELAAKLAGITTPEYYFKQGLSAAEREKIEKSEVEKAMTAEPKFVRADELIAGSNTKQNAEFKKILVVNNAEDAVKAAEVILGKSTKPAITEKPYLPQTMDIYSRDIYYKLYIGDAKYEGFRVNLRKAAGAYLVAQGVIGDSKVLEPQVKDMPKIPEITDPFTKLFLSLNTDQWNGILKIVKVIGPDGEDLRPDFRRKASK